MDTALRDHYSISDQLGVSSSRNVTVPAIRVRDTRVAENWRRSREAHVHETDISRISASYTALMLGISNMRRRKLRTGLTMTTLTLLTFTVLSFTSFTIVVDSFAALMIVVDAFTSFIMAVDLFTAFIIVADSFTSFTL